MSRRKRNKASPAPTPPANGERRHLWAVCILCAVGFLAYSNIFPSTFHFDDLLVIVNNPAIRHPWDFAAIFNAFNTRFIPGWTFALNYGLGGLDVFGYHFFNVWLHVCNAALVYLFVHQILSLDGKMQARAKGWTALAAALIFLTHPVQTQAVNYVWQRTTLLACFFYLGTLTLYIQARRYSVRSFYRAALVTCLAAMFCKEISFTLPLAVLLLELHFLRRTCADKRSWFWALPFLLMLLVIPILLLRANTSTLPIMRPNDFMSGVAEDVISRKDYWLTQFNAALTYLRLFVWPAGLNVDHDYPPASQSGWVPAFVFVTALAGTGIALVRKIPIMAFGILWFFLTLSVESIVISADLLVEHRLYLPMVGLSVLLAWGLCRIYSWNIKLAGGILVAIAVLFGVMTFVRNGVWHDDVRLWTDAIQKSPGKARPYNNRGVVFRKLNFLDSAIADFTHAIVIDPTYPEAYYNRGGAYKMKGDFEAAAKDYAKVIELEPNNYQGFDARGYIYRRQGMLDEALKDFNASIELNPRNPEVYNNRAYIYQKKGDRESAIDDYSHAITADPTYIYAYNNRGNLYLEQGLYSKAVVDYTTAIRLKTNFGEAYVNRAVAFFGLGRLHESQADVERAQGLRMRINPEFLQKLKKAISAENHSTLP